MKVKVDKTVVITLTMDREEASWLQCMLNSPIEPGEPNNEYKEDAMFRKLMLKVMNKALGLTTTPCAAISDDIIECNKCHKSFTPVQKKSHAQRVAKNIL